MTTLGILSVDYLINANNTRFVRNNKKHKQGPSMSLMACIIHFLPKIMFFQHSVTSSGQGLQTKRQACDQEVKSGKFG